MRLRTSLLVFAGAILAIASAELTLRAVEEHLPVLSDWPTVETEVKSAQFARLEENPELLIVGSSMVESAVDPHALVSMGAASSAYNSAFPFSTPAAMDIWLRDYLRPWDGLEVVVIGLPAWPPPADLASDPLATGLIEAFGADLVADPFEDVALWRLRGLLADLGEATRRERTVAAGLWTELGHQTVYYGRSAGSLVGRFPPYGEPEMSEVQERGLRRIVATARQAGATPVVLLEAGRFPGVVDDRTVAAYLDTLYELTADLDVPLWDAYSLDWDESLYADEVHFNEEGARAFTAYLGALLDLLGGG